MAKAGAEDIRVALALLQRGMLDAGERVCIQGILDQWRHQNRNDGFSIEDADLSELRKLANRLE